MKFIFKTNVSMKPYNCKKWWIDEKYCPDLTIIARNLNDAILAYCDIIDEKCSIKISKTALLHKEPMYRDRNGEAIQVGYVITGSLKFLDDCHKWSKQYIDLWAEILTITETAFN